jgi:hypothetical protein
VALDNQPSFRHSSVAFLETGRLGSDRPSLRPRPTLSRLDSVATSIRTFVDQSRKDLEDSRPDETRLLRHPDR